MTEFYVTPFDLFVWNDESRSVVSDLEAGARIRFRILLADRDVPYDRAAPPRSVYSFPEITLSSGSEGDQLAHGILVSREAISESPVTELPAASWATIKASMSPGVGRRDP